MNLTLTIDHKTVQVPEGTTIFDAAKTHEIEIPHLCFYPGLPPNTSCMLCVVQDSQSGRLIPSCSAPVAEGMVVETQNATLDQARRSALELILREHVGDCEAPCQKVCPLHLFIPKMIRLIARCDLQEATNIVYRALGLPGFLSTLCPAPCLKGCRRSQHDSGVSIPHLVRYVVAQNLLPVRQKNTPDVGKPTSVAVIGAGPTGLSAAMEIVNHGHHCTLFDSNTQIGGKLRQAELEETSSHDLWRQQTRVLKAWGIDFKGDFSLETRAQLVQLTQEWDGVILTTGGDSLPHVENWSLPASKTGIKVDASGATGLAGVFAAGDAVKPLRTLPKAIGAGQNVARSVLKSIEGKKLFKGKESFNSKMGRLHEGEIETFLSCANGADAIIPSKPANGNTPTADQACEEAQRCLHCDCRKPQSCKLRQYADQLGAKAQRFKMEKRPKFAQENAKGHVIFEPMKCIKCGICVQIMGKYKSYTGLTFINRGIDMRPTVPFGVDLDEALGPHALECVQACPTAALAFSKTPPQNDHKTHTNPSKTIQEAP